MLTTVTERGYKYSWYYYINIQVKNHPYIFLNNVRPGNRVYLNNTPTNAHI
jgi:hypothetical protein